LGRRKQADAVPAEVGAEAVPDTEPREVPVTMAESGAPDVDTADQGAVAAAPTGETPAETEDWHDRYLRLVAEFDNFRKRSAREFGNLVVSAERELIADLTEVLDNFERAINTGHKGEPVEEFAKGVTLIRDQLWDVLGRRGLKKMDVLGTPFDPEAHDALMKVPSEEYDDGIIAQVVSPGYRLGEKVLRHAKVIVSQGRPSADSGADTTKEE